jgi:ABC-type branched-subunit amino acid transport system ATPase component
VSGATEQIAVGDVTGPISVDDAASARGLHVRDVVVRFGGLLAVDGVSLDVPVGRAIGLIGPNGAGKTTTFNACSGLNRPTSGRVDLFGTDVSHASAAARARLGMGRTFQRMELYDRLTVRQNVAMGLEARLVGKRRLFGSIFATASERREVTEATDRALERCGITRLAENRAGVLPSGQRRLVELARALAGGFELLLLDEPSSGLDPAETTGFASVLRSVVHEDGCGILLVEHDMSLVRAVCEYTYVLDFGKLIAQGPTSEVLESDLVRAAYLGEAEVA